MMLVKALMVGALLLGCAPAAHRSGPLLRSGDVQLVVTNDGWLDQVIYTYYLGQKNRIGTITGFSTGVLRIPSRLLAPDNTVQLLVHPIGGDTDFITDVVTLGSDDHPELTINPSLNSAFLAVLPNRSPDDEP
jgi:hypothetical protein